MLEEIIREIEEMEYPRGEIYRGLRLEGIKDRGGAAAYGFGDAQERIVEIIRSHSNDGWVYCGDGKSLPEKEGLVLVQVNGKHGNVEFEAALQLAEYCRGDGWIVEGYLEWKNPEVVAWHPLPEIYRSQKSVGEDYK